MVATMTVEDTEAYYPTATRIEPMPVTVNINQEALIPDAIFKSLAVIVIAFSLIYRKMNGKWPWE